MQVITGLLSVMKKILLINPPFYRLMGSHFNGLSLGLSYISSVLQRAGFDVMIYNADFLEKEEYLDQTQIFDNFNLYKTILNDRSQSVWGEIKGRVSAYAPDVVGITMHTGTYKSVKNIAEIVKEISKGIPVIVGGPHPTLDPEGTLADDNNIDFAVRGEGEYTFLELVQGKSIGDILGVSYKNGDHIIHNPDRPFINDLDSLPFPDRASIFDADKHDLAQVMTGRGCPFVCSFCASPKLWKRKVRFRSVGNVMGELREIKNIKNGEVLYFVDDTFTIDSAWVGEFCNLMINFL